jgi:hypothetical protein
MPGHPRGPVIETGYFDEPGDLRDAVGAYRFAAEIAGAETMRQCCPA